MDIFEDIDSFAERAEYDYEVLRKKREKVRKVLFLIEQEMIELMTDINRQRDTMLIFLNEANRILK